MSELAGTLPETPAARRHESNLSLGLGVGAVVLFFVLGGIASYYNTSTLRSNSQRVANTHLVLSALDDVLSLMKDAETGQRGFVITGDERYLAPHATSVAALPERLGLVDRLTREDPEQHARLGPLQEQIAGKLSELEKSIAARRNDGFEAARALVATDRGKVHMDAVRTLIAEMERSERETRTRRQQEMEEAYRIAVGSGILTGLLGVVLSGAVAYLLWRAMRSRRRQEWLQTGQVRLGVAVTGDQRVDVLGERILGLLADYTDAHAGALYIKDASEFRRVAVYGTTADGAPPKFAMGEGLLGRAAADGKTFLLRDVPDGYITVYSALGRSKPRNLVIAPFAVDRYVNAVVELGFIHPLEDATLELLAEISEPVASAVRSADYRATLQNLLEETQRQSEELQAQAEELRVSNEELEEQGRALRESQVRLEQQQSELEQTNSQLEEQTQILESQRDELGRASEELKLKAGELDQASRYKSDFLANMSHELRTPLNSSLILSKLLADNPAGNLTDEQVRYAETIQSAGNDLLTLINDILDLSKIEAGHMEIRPEPFALADMAESLERIFQPLAAQKNIDLKLELAPGCPAGITSDRQRLEQVLKNLLSNAVKFTETGGVGLRISSSEGGRIAFAVSDSGIGIAPEHQQLVFEAFKQSDGTTSRRHGGTGLGLSIARELARLLGGEIHLASEVGKGSTFTVDLPAEIDAAASTRPPESPAQRPKAVPAASAFVPTRSASQVRPATPRVPDDRESLSGDKRVILVVEDDVTFARIVKDLAHELGFQCLVATTADEGLAVAAQFRPSAVVLDIGLPDQIGLSVLDRLKHDARTRHIPVHVVSAHDYSQTALSLGAVGYMMKPVKREELVRALQNIESRLDRRMRSVLIVEDDPVQLESLRKLLGAHDVEAVGVASANECLEKLRNTTFDCMVLDLTLPDASGHALLDTLSREDHYSFPPVIVYTGRELSADEEQRLRRYSKSIIIKGAKSPERLLDEVTLFLHQVVSELPAEQQKMLEQARNRDATLEGRCILVVEDDVRNVFALTSILEPRGAVVEIARNGIEALAALEKANSPGGRAIDLVLMDVMMPEMDGITAVREIRKRPGWAKLPVIALTAKAMRDDQEQCLSAGANDYMAKPLNPDRLLSLVRVWMPR